MLMKRLILATAASAVFFFMSVWTLPHYNIMWDARNHFFKGQAFANFFLFGRTNYDGLPVTREAAKYYRDYLFRSYDDPAIEQNISSDPNYRRSIYQDKVHTFAWLMARPATEHPVFSDILSSLSNILFYEKLGWLRDDHAYNLLAVFLASVLVGVLFYWTMKVYGVVAALIATLTLTTTGLFWAESHNNIKDIPQLAFFSLAVFAWWQGLTKKSRWWLIGSAIAAGAALATKFNIVFLPFILGPWTILWFLKSDKAGRKFFIRSWWILLLYPAIMFTILVGSWPQLWHDPIGEFLNVLAYYKAVGVGIDYTPRFRTLFGWSYYPLLWIAVTTYPALLILGVIGVMRVVSEIRKEKQLLGPLFLLWLLVPIGRASLPSTSIFGGVRHIIEYLPAFAGLAGLGAVTMLTVFKRHKIIVSAILVLVFIPHIATLVRLHPAENAYFNSLIGGLSGAKEKKLTGWGNTDGGIYRKALTWINENAEPDSHLATSISELADFYLPEFREDLRADNLFSGYLQQGEYVIGLTHNSELENTYRLLYPETYLVPVYEYTVDGVALIKIWKNDAAHVRDELKNLRKRTLAVTPKRDGKDLLVDLGKPARVEWIRVEYKTQSSCTALEVGYLEVSEDGKVWTRPPETYPGGPIEALGPQPAGGTLVIPVAAIGSRYLAFHTEPERACILINPSVSVGILE